MKKKGHTPITRSKTQNPIYQILTGSFGLLGQIESLLRKLRKRLEKQRVKLLKIMRRSIKPVSFRLWRKRVNQKSIKHKKKFEYSRKEITSKIKKNDYL